MNDTVLDVDMAMLAAAAAHGRFRALDLPFVLELGRELFAETPLLQRDAPERAERLAALIASKSPRTNAALFEAPCAGCATEDVSARLEIVEPAVMASLLARQTTASLTPVVADGEVWRRMAA